MKHNVKKIFALLNITMSDTCVINDSVCSRYKWRV